VPCTGYRYEFDPTTNVLEMIYSFVLGGFSLLVYIDKLLNGPICGLYKKRGDISHPDFTKL